MFERQERPPRFKSPIPPDALILPAGIFCVAVVVMPASLPPDIYRLAFLLPIIVLSLFLIYKLEDFLKAYHPYQECNFWQRLVLIVSLGFATMGVVWLHEQMLLSSSMLLVVIVAFISYIGSHKKTVHPDPAVPVQRKPLFPGFTKFYLELREEPVFLQRQRSRQYKLASCYSWILVWMVLAMPLGLFSAPIAQVLTGLLGSVVDLLIVVDPPIVVEARFVLVLGSALLVLVSFLLGLRVAILLAEIAIYDYQEHIWWTGLVCSVFALGLLVVAIFAPVVQLPPGQFFAAQVFALVLFPSIPLLLLGGGLFLFFWKLQWFFYRYARAKTAQERIRLCEDTLKSTAGPVWFRAYLQVQLAANRLSDPDLQWNKEVLQDVSKLLDRAKNLFDKFDASSLKYYVENNTSLNLAQGLVESLRVYHEDSGDRLRESLTTAIKNFAAAAETAPTEKGRIIARYNLGVARITRAYYEQQTDAYGADQDQAVNRAPSEGVQQQLASEYDDAIECLQDAHYFHSHENNDIELAMVNYTLGTTYWQRLDGDRKQNLDKARRYLGEVPKSLPEIQAIAQARLGVIAAATIKAGADGPLPVARDSTSRLMVPLLSMIGLQGLQKIEPEHEEAAAWAVKHLEEALKVFRGPEEVPRFPLECYCVAYMLGMIRYAWQQRDGHAVKDRFRLAYEAFVQAHQACEQLRSKLVSDSESVQARQPGTIANEQIKQQLGAFNENLYMRLVHSCIELQKIDEAFQYVSAAKGRLFADQLASSDFNFSALMRKHKPEIVEVCKEMDTVRQEISRLEEAELRSKGVYQQDVAGKQWGPQDQSRQRLQEKRAEYAKQEHDLWKKLYQEIPGFSTTVSIEPLTANHAQQLAHDLGATLVEFYRHMDGWCVYICCPGQKPIKHFALPDLDTAIDEMNDWIKRGECGMTSICMKTEELSDWYQAVFQQIDEYVSANVPAQQIDKYVSANVPAQHHPRRLVIAPHGKLHVLPIGLAYAEEQYMLEKYVLSFMPSLCALHVLDQKHAQHASDAAAGSRDSTQFLSVVYPGLPQHKKFLPNAVKEGKEIAEFARSQVGYSITELHEQRACVASIITAMQQSHIIHIACHGGFDPKHPWSSALHFCDGDISVLRALMEIRMERAPLLSLAACLTASAMFDRGDEPVGLTQSMLLIGAQTVVSTLWNIDDAATRILMMQFYCQITQGAPPAAALQKAIQYMRRTMSQHLDHPYYWGAFQISGLVRSSGRTSENLSECDLRQQVAEVSKERIRREEERIRREGDMQDKKLTPQQINERVGYYLRSLAKDLKPHGKRGQQLQKMLLEHPDDLRKVQEAFQRLAKESQSSQVDEQVFQLVDEVSTLRAYLVAENDDHGKHRGILSQQEYDEQCSLPFPAKQDYTNIIPTIRDLLEDLVKQINVAGEDKSMPPPASKM